MEVLECYHEAILSDLRNETTAKQHVPEAYLEEHRQLGKFCPHL